MGCESCGAWITDKEYNYSMKHFKKPLCRKCQPERDYQQKREPTYHAKKLYDALTRKRIKCRLEDDSDGYKSVDITIEWAALHIEIDGKHHVYNPKQVFRDIKRAEYSSEEGVFTLRYSNEDIDRDVEGLAKSIASVARKRYNERND